MNTRLLRKAEVGVSETACCLDDVKVRLFGNWLRRDGKWELIAVQGAAVPCKPAQ